MDGSQLAGARGGAVRLLRGGRDAGGFGRARPPAAGRADADRHRLQAAGAPGLVLLLHEVFVDVPDVYLVQPAMACALNSLVVANEYGLDRGCAPERWPGPRRWCSWPGSWCPCCRFRRRAALRTPRSHVRRRAPAGAPALRALGRDPGWATSATRARRTPRSRSADGAEPTWFPDRTWGGRTYLPLTVRRRGGRRAVRLRVLAARPRGRPGGRLQGRGQLHRGHRVREPRLAARPLRRGDRPLAGHRGPAGRR